MKKTLCALSLMLIIAISAVAVPAKPGWHTIKQSDGTTLQVQAVGNAFNHAILTTDGLTVARGDDGDFYYTSSLTGLTAVRAHDDGQRTPGESAFVNSQRANLAMQVKSFGLHRGKNKLGFGGSNAEAAVPSMGQRRIPIILVEFQDKKFSNSREDIIAAMLTGDESVGQYFRDQSNGLYEPEFDVYGIYSLSQNRSYYGANQGGHDKGVGWMVTEACQLVAADGVSFAPYDTDNNSFCDVVIIIFAGVGEAQAATNHPEALWPRNWTLDAAVYYSCGGYGAFRPSTGDPYVNHFAVFNELHGSNDNSRTIDGIGTFAHEFGHCLGLPDFYDTGTGDYYGMGHWDIMCLGCYNNDSYTPSGYTAYEKAFMGWVNYMIPRPDRYYTLPVWNQKNAATDKALRINSDLNENEYFIIENRKRQGWDRYLPGEGIMITHVTFDADHWKDNTPNNESIQLMTIVPADNYLSAYSESSDLWPRSGKTAFTDTSVPAARLNMTSDGSITGNAGYLGKPVTEMVINNDGTASFWYMKGIVVNPAISVSPYNIDFGAVMMNSSATRTFTLRGQALDDDVVLTLSDSNGAFTINPSVINADDACNGMTVTVTFNPLAIQSYNATLTLSSSEAEDVVVNLAGSGLIEGYAPVMQPALSQYIGLSQFRADWTDRTPNGNVASYTLEVKTKPAVTQLVDADFSNVPDAVTATGTGLLDISGNPSGYLPAGWSGTYFLGAFDGALIIAFDGTVKTSSFNLQGNEKMTVVIKCAAYYYDNAMIRISTSKGSQELTLSNEMTDYVVVLDCGDIDDVTIQSLTNYASIKQIAVYSGVYSPVRLNAYEVGDDTYRLITGISDKFYIVSGLEAAGTYIYKVKTLFVDGTESAWSNVEEVTLFESGHGFDPGDVNHDQTVNISDVTTLINYLLSGNGACEICADVNKDGNINVSDVTTLINRLLTHD